MTRTSQHHSHVLAVHPHTKGIGWVVFEGPFSALDWGTSEPKDKKSPRCLTKVERLIERYQPHTVVLEGISASTGARIARLHRAIVSVATAQSMEVAIYSRGDVKGCFASVGAQTRQEIAEAVGRQVPALSRFVPRPKRRWEGEQLKAALFVAASLAITHYALGAQRFLDGLDAK